MKFKRKLVGTLSTRLEEEARYLQIIIGPRQVGKTTCSRQLQEQSKIPTVYSAADSAGIPDSTWINTKWLEARSLLTKSSKVLLILDEVQLVNEWQQAVKALWDEDRLNKVDLHVIITGSSALLLKKGTESLSGRFEKHELLQWSFSEMREAFGFSLEDYILFGGYPGAASIKTDELRWKEYIRSALIETVITKDVIALSKITKPSLMQQLFKIACFHPAEIVSYTKFLGQLADVGNVTTLSDYRMALEDAYILKTLDKWSGSIASSKASKPKWIIRDNSLVTSMQSITLSEIKNTPLYGRLVENAVISHILRLIPEGYYWREKNAEVDYVLEYHGKIYALEIKSGNVMRSYSGLNEFKKKNKKAITLVIGGGGIPLEDILSAETWLW